MAAMAELWRILGQDWLVDSRAPGIARHHIRSLLTGLTPAGVVDDALFASTELVTNLVLAGGLPALFTICYRHRTPRTVRVTFDGGTQNTIRAEPTDFISRILQAVSSEWGIEVTKRGERLW